MAPPKRGRRVILVVDDDPDIRAALEDILSICGYDVAVARNGREALQRLRANPIDLVLLDLMMPVMTGWEFREEQLRDADTAAVPVVVISAVRSPAPPPASAFLPKPFDLDRLLEVVEQFAPVGLGAERPAANGRTKTAPAAR